MSQVQAPFQPQPQKSNAGCWLVGFISTFIAMVLVVVALFLPPFDLYNRLLGEPFVVLQQAGEAITTNDNAFSLAAATDVEGEFGVLLNTVPLQSFEAASAEAGDWVPTAKNAVPYYLALQSPVYDIRTSGTAPDAVQISLRIPPAAPEADLLDLYGWYSDADGMGGDWQFIPASAQNNTLITTTSDLPDSVAIFQAAPDTPEVMVSYDVTTALSSDAAQLASIVAPAGLQPTLTGAVAGSLAPGFDVNASYRVMPVIRDFVDPNALDTETVEAIIGNSDLRSEHVAQLTQLTGSGGFDGIFIDYRGLEAEQRANFTAFIQELSASLRANGRLLGVVVPSAQNENGLWQTGAYDWRAIGATADYMQIDLSINPQDYAPGETQFIEAMLRWATDEVDRYKVLLGLSAQSVREIAGTYTSIGYDAALAGLGNVVIEADTTEAGTINPGTELRASLDGLNALAGVDTIINAPFIDYLDSDGNRSARLWLTTGEALRYRMNRTLPFALGGVAFNDLMADDLADDVLTAIDSYRKQIPGAPSPTDLALRWRIENTDGLIDEVTTNINEDLVVTLAAPDGNYAINVAVVGRGEDVENESVRTGASVALFQPTPTPTPLPTATPTPTPTQTPTPEPIVPTAAPVVNSGGNAAPSGTGGGNAVAPTGGLNLSGFEYGGHVTSAASGRAANAMRSAGMTWMKVQIRYRLGGGTGDAIAQVNAAKANGFKILIGTVGVPEELRSGGDAYLQQYAQWLAGIAAGGADAIEVWNEPNLDREWPNGQLSGASYANMLRIAYNAIKGANPGTIVISGAPAPTGAEAAFPGAVLNDDNFLRQMVNAGGMQYLDCVGAHYNEGIVSPTQTSGDPRGNYYTRYFDTMVNTYWSITGGSKPLCFTELGFLTSEGYPPLPSFFSWAENVTLQQQAAWLAQAAVRASQSGRVSLMIVWNVDFTLYASDPQGGYAMIRPDGSCPACQALANAR